MLLHLTPLVPMSHRAVGADSCVCPYTDCALHWTLAGLRCDNIITGRHGRLPLQVAIVVSSLLGVGWSEDIHGYMWPWLPSFLYSLRAEIVLEGRAFL